MVLKDVDEREINSVLDRITASATFARANRAAGLLRYLVGMTTGGRASEIKEYTIAAEFFKRSSYDPKIDSAVRVEAAKMRQLLARYYETEGSDDQVRIDVHRGSYTPVITRAQPAPVPPPVQTSSPGRDTVMFYLAISGAVLLLTIVWTMVSRTLAHHRLPATAVFSVAVLPFEDMSAGRTYAYLGDGISDELIGKLTNLDGIRVAARTSSFQYRGRSTDVRRVAADLGVATILEGSVRPEQGRVRITAQLVDAHDGFHLWSSSYDEPLGDPGEIARRLSAEIARVFYQELVDLRRALVLPRSPSSDAWHYYVRAIQLNGVHIGETMQAVELFKAALTADPQFALGWASLSMAYSTLIDWRESRPADTLPLAWDAAEHALTLEPRLSEAHRAAGEVHAYRREWIAADAEFRKAIELDRTNWDTHRAYARLVLTPLRRFDESVAQLREGIALRPTENTLHQELAGTLVKARRYEEAEAAINDAVRLAPDSIGTHIQLGALRGAQGDQTAALSEFNAAARKSRSAWILSYTGYTLGKMGRAAEARAILNELPHSLAASSTDLEIAAIYAGLRDSDRALLALERAEAAQSPGIFRVHLDYRFDDLHQNPRYTALIEKLHLPGLP